MSQAGDSEITPSGHNATHHYSRACAIYRRIDRKNPQVAPSQEIIKRLVPDWRQLFQPAHADNRKSVTSLLIYCCSASLQRLTHHAAVCSSRDNHIACHRSDGVRINNNSAAAWWLAYEVVLHLDRNYLCDRRVSSTFPQRGSSSCLCLKEPAALPAPTPADCLPADSAAKSSH